MKKLLIMFAIVALATVSAAETHRITFYQPSVVGQTELKPGDYKLELNDNQVVISRGSQKAEAQVKVETVESKFRSTSVRYINGDGKLRVSEIRIGGTNTKLIFN